MCGDEHGRRIAELDQQQMRAGNKATLDHVTDGRSLRVFQGATGMVRYLGEYAVDPEDPYYVDRQPQTRGGPMRSVLVFRLRPVDYSSPAQAGTSQLGLATRYRRDRE